MKLSGHVKERMAQMGVDADEVYAALRAPEMVYDSQAGHGPDRKVYVAGRVAVVTWSKQNPRDGRVITVLWHTKEGREHAC